MKKEISSTNPREKVKLDLNTEVWVQKIKEVRENNDGTFTKVLEWERLNKPMSLGSFKNPINNNIEAFEIRETRTGGINKDDIDRVLHKWFRKF